METIMTKLWNRWNCYRKTVRELEKLTARDLADIGISACDIPAIAREEALNRYK